MLRKIKSKRFRQQEAVEPLPEEEEEQAKDVIVGEPSPSYIGRAKYVRPRRLSGQETYIPTGLIAKLKAGLVKAGAVVYPYREKVRAKAIEKGLPVKPVPPPLLTTAAIAQSDDAHRRVLPVDQ